MQSWDLQILQMFNGLAGHNQVFDLIVKFFTNYSPLIFAVWFAYYFFRRSPHRDRSRRTVLLSGISGVVAIAITAVLGHFIDRARPFAVLPPDQIHLLISHAADSSFPSDHTMGSAAFATGMLWAPDRSARPLFWVTALLVGASRLIAGVHWPSDVVGSLALGSLIAWGVMALERPLTPVLDWILKVVRRRAGAKTAQ